MTNIDAITKSNVENKNNSSVQRLYSLGIKSDKGILSALPSKERSEVNLLFINYLTINILLAFPFCVAILVLCVSWLGYNN